MNSFVFDKFNFDELNLRAEFFYYHTDPNIGFKEVFEFPGPVVDYSKQQLNKAMELAFLVVGTSYFKAFPTSNVKFNQFQPDQFQLSFLRQVYTKGLSQFAFENRLDLNQLPFADAKDFDYQSDQIQLDDQFEILSLQSGGKDSLLTAESLYQAGFNFEPFNIPYGQQYPDILNDFKKPTRFVKRHIDKQALISASSQGALNGHVPVTYIITAIAIIDAVLHGQNVVMLSIGHEGDEAHAQLDWLEVSHQWSKTYQAEKMMQSYVSRLISKKMAVGSAIRKYSELKVAELFVQKCRDKYSRSFSSCNLANYKQEADNTKLNWCKKCPKCANSFLLFAPFVQPDELISVMGSDMFADPDMEDTFKGLLGVDGKIKPFECIAEVDELRKAYHMAQARWGDNISKLKFEVPESDFDLNKTYDYNKFFDKIIK